MRMPALALTSILFCAVLLAACGDSGSSSSTKTATVPSGKLGAVPSGAGKRWVHIHYHFNGYQGKDSRGAPYQCGHAVSSDSQGGCYFQQEHTDEGRGYPFTSNATFIWKDAGGLCSNPAGNEKPAGAGRHQVRLTTGSGVSPAGELCGWIDNGWVKMDVTWGSFAGKTVLPTGNGKLEQQGGPLFVFMSYNGHPKGYILGLRGWLQY
jgi:hypothetical protein